MPKITGIVCNLPSKEIDNKYFEKYHDSEYVKKSTKLVGLEKRYWANRETSLSMCVAACEILITNYSKILSDKNYKKKIDLLIYITQTPTCLMPAEAYNAHKLLDLSDQCICMTINAGCTAYVDGISLIFDMMKSRGYKNGILLVGDVLTKHLNKNDFGTFSVFGDAGCATLITNNNRKTNYITAGGTVPSSNDALTLGYPTNTKNNFINMKGFDVYTFAINKIPKIINLCSEKWEKFYDEKPKIDYYLLHQANKMIINHVIKKTMIDENRIPINIEKFGNTSGVTIPLLICSNFNKNDLKGLNILMCGFGVGLSWSAIITNSLLLKIS